MSQGLIEAPVFTGFETASFTYNAHGVTPSSCVVSVHPEDFRPQSRPFTVRLSYDRAQISFHDCILDGAGLTYGAGGNRVNVRILDHRWRWEFAKEPWTAHVNRRIGKRIMEDTKKSAREIASELLQAAGERQPDIELVPDNDYPEMLVQGDKAPMVTLQELLATYGLRVCYIPQRQRVKIVRPGEGENLPDNEFLAYPSWQTDPPERPTELWVVGAELIVQARWKLKAVGEETDDNDAQILPIDDLSYTPEDGWNKTFPESMSAVEDEDGRRKAKKSVFRYYQIDRTDDAEEEGEELVPFLKDIQDRNGDPVEITRLDQVLPVSDKLTDVETLEDGTERPLKAKVRGEWYEGYVETRDDEQNAEDGNYEGSWSLDGENGVVMFSEPVYIYDREDEDEGPIKPAELTLECVFTVRTAVDEARLRPVFKKRVSSQGGGIKVISRPDLRRVITFEEGEMDDGLREFEEEAQLAAEEFLSGLSTQKGAVGIYNRIEPVAFDGAIQQAAYQMGPGGATTQLSRNVEAASVSPAYVVRRRIALANAQLSSKIPDAAQDVGDVIGGAASTLGGGLT